MKRILTVLLSVMLMLSLTACGEVVFPSITEVFKESKPGESGKKISLEYKVGSIGEPSEPHQTDIPDGKPHVISMSLKESVIIIPVGKTGRIEHTVSPKTAYDKSVYYKCSDETVVKVDKDGNVLGLKPGAVSIEVRTNDFGFRRYCTVIVTRGSGDQEKSDKVVELINTARVANGYSATKASNKSLQAAADQRAFEEAVDIVNYGDTGMNNKRSSVDKDGVRTDLETDIFTNYNIWSKASNAVYIWGIYTPEEVYKAFIEDDVCAEALGVRGSGATSYEYFAVGYFEFDGITYWSILMTSS